MPQLRINTIIILPPLSSIKCGLKAVRFMHNTFLIYLLQNAVKYYCFVVLIHYTFKYSIFIRVCETYMATLAATVLSSNLLYSSKF